MKDHIFGMTIFPEHLQKISYFHVFFWERSSLIFRLRSYFREKEIPSVLIIQERSHSSATFFGKTIFPEHSKKENMVFRAVERSLYWYIGSLHITTITYTAALTIKQVAKKVLFSPCLIDCISMSLTKMT